MFLIVPVFFMTKDSKIDHLNGKKNFVVELFQVQEEGDLELAAFIIEQLCTDLTFEVGINFNFYSVYLLANYRVIRLAHPKILLLDPIF